mgnify:CR=1 FL=1
MGLNWGVNQMFIRRLTAAVLVAVFAAIFLFLFLTTPWNSYDEKRFIKSIWISERGNNAIDNLRGPMAVDACKQILPNMTIPQVIDLLGEPDMKSEGCILYYIGAWGTGNMDEGFLAVTYSDNRVVKTFLRNN